MSGGQLSFQAFADRDSSTVPSDPESGFPAHPPLLSPAVGGGTTRTPVGFVFMRAVTIRDKEIVIEELHPDPVPGPARCSCGCTPPG